ncbi:hypothetical protein NA57DRAFT_57963 [Rhizodiscina lignyota]|uniref:IBR domain-containing protein n=1 Tax=Rhizodiscina lignyota TaxID=1504668 RepID=A0A9P4ICX0_9PEZI|nr:hypothetical protein NA57DRAFT_57963 [Rhizodiscina lignyota]
MAPGHLRSTHGDDSNRRRRHRHKHDTSYNSDDHRPSHKRHSAYRDEEYDRDGHRIRSSHRHRHRVDEDRSRRNREYEGRREVAARGHSRRYGAVEANASRRRHAAPGTLHRTLSSSTLSSITSASPHLEQSSRISEAPLYHEQLRQSQTGHSSRRRPGLEESFSRHARHLPRPARSSPPVSARNPPPPPAPLPPPALETKSDIGSLSSDSSEDSDDERDTAPVSMRTPPPLLNHTPATTPSVAPIPEQIIPSASVPTSEMPKGDAQAALAPGAPQYAAVPPQISSDPPPPSLDGHRRYSRTDNNSFLSQLARSTNLHSSSRRSVVSTRPKLSTPPAASITTTEPQPQTQPQPQPPRPSMRRTVSTTTAPAIIRRKTTGSILSSILKPQTQPSAPSAPAEPPAPEEKVECLTCCDEVPVSQSAKLECDHVMCNSCLKRIFRLSVKDPEHMPPKCCTEHHIPLNLVAPLFDNKFKTLWNEKFREFSTKDRMYCPKAGCGEWIQPKDIKLDRSVGRRYGTCTNRCTAEFCMICGLKWKTCDCPWFNTPPDAEDMPFGGMLFPPPALFRPRIRMRAAGHFGYPPPLPGAARGAGGFHAEIAARRAQERADERLARQLQAQDFGVDEPIDPLDMVLERDFGFGGMDAGANLAIHLMGIAGLALRDDELGPDVFQAARHRRPSPFGRGYWMRPQPGENANQPRGRRARSPPRVPPGSPDFERHVLRADIPRPRMPRTPEAPEAPGAGVLRSAEVPSVIDDETTYSTSIWASETDSMGMRRAGLGRRATVHESAMDDLPGRPSTAAMAGLAGGGGGLSRGRDRVGGWLEHVAGAPAREYTPMFGGGDRLF